MLCHFDFQFCNLLIGHIGKRQAAVAAVEAHQVQCLLYRDWVDVHEQCVHEVEILKRECLRRLEVARNGSGGKMCIRDRSTRFLQRCAAGYRWRVRLCIARRSCFRTVCPAASKRYRTQWCCVHFRITQRKPAPRCCFAPIILKARRKSAQALRCWSTAFYGRAATFRCLRPLLKMCIRDSTYAGMDMLYGPYVLYQIGDLSCEAGYQTFEHEQAVYEITYVLSGTGAFYVDDTVYTCLLYTSRYGRPF